MRRRTLNIYFSWLVVAMVYYGLSFNTKNIGANIYVSNFVSGFAEIVACVLIIPGQKNVFSAGRTNAFQSSLLGPHNGILS
jgi:hypothetical protein